MYKWKFFKSARCVQVKLENGEDLAALKELDQKLWTVLAASKPTDARYAATVWPAASFSSPFIFNIFRSPLLAGAAPGKKKKPA